MASEPAPVRLGTWPTPLDPAPRLSEAAGLGPDGLWIKRDDLIGLGGAATRSASCSGRVPKPWPRGHARWSPAVHRSLITRA